MLAGVVVLTGSLVGTVLSFYAIGAVVDLLVDRGAVVCGETVGCGIGVGFLLVLTGVAVVALGAAAALVLPFVLPARWSTARAMRCAAAVTGVVVLLAIVAMLLVWLSGAGGEPPPA